MASLPRESTGVLIGAQCDAEIARYGLRWRLNQWQESWQGQGLAADDAWLGQAQEAAVAGLQAAGVVGTMPNIPANRLNNQLNLGGPSATYSAEELSGLVALELAARALRLGDMDAAVVGAVDLSCEPVHGAAAAAVLPENRQIPGDAAVLLVLERLEDARRQGRDILAVIDDVGTGEPRTPKPSPDESKTEPAPQTLRFGPDATEPGTVNLTPAFGHSHAASGLLHVAAAVLACKHRSVPAGGGLQGRPWISSAPRRAKVEVQSRIAELRPQHGYAWIAEEPTEAQGVEEGISEPEAAARHVESRVHQGPAHHGPSHDGPAHQGSSHHGPVRWPVFEQLSGSGRKDLVARLRDRISNSNTPAHSDAPEPVGPARLVLFADDEQGLIERRAKALEALEGLADESDALTAPGIHYRRRPVGGELAFVFTGAAAAYPGMGRDLLLATPELHGPLGRRMGRAADSASWVYDGTADAPDVLHQLWGASFLCQAHAELSKKLGLSPQAAIGYSSGESNSLMALGVWNDLEGLHNDTLSCGIFTQELGGPMKAVARHWQLPDQAHEHGEGAIAWSNWIVRAPVESIRAALEGEEQVYLTIINSPEEAVIGGQSDATARVLSKLDAQVYPLGYPMAVHSPEVDAVREPWLELHRRPTTEVEGIRFYTHADGGRSYRPDRESAAQAILGQALDTVDFPAMVKKAWDDGVRVFLEHGPRGLCSRWIQASLDAHGVDRNEYLAVSWDSLGQGNIHHAAGTVADLLAAGLDLNVESLWRRKGLPVQRLEGPSLSFPSHWPAVELPPLSGAEQPSASPSQAPIPVHSVSDSNSEETSPAKEAPTASLTVEPLPRTQPLSRAETTVSNTPTDTRDPGSTLPQTPAPQVMAPAPTLPSVFHDPPESPSLHSPSAYTEPASATAAPIPTESSAQQTPQKPQPASAAIPSAGIGPHVDPGGPSSGSPIVGAPIHGGPESDHAIANQVMAGLADLQARLANAQRDFLHHQTQIHRQFLELRQRDLQRLGVALTSSGSSVAASATGSTTTTAGMEPSVPTFVPALAPPGDFQAPTVSVPTTPAPSNGSGSVSATPEIALEPPALSPTPRPTPSPAPSEPTPVARKADAPAPKAKPTAALQAPAATAPQTFQRGDAPELLPGPKIDRQGLLTLASGKISEVFGPLFEGQDQYHRQVRMPEPPFLFADRVTGIEGEPRKLGTGIIWTETDVRDDSWYLYRGRMPGGLMIEAGQADLLLISWQGIDFLNKSERVYRLLGCELTYRGELPKPGETLKYEIHIDGHAKQGDVRLFFFHYDCRVDGETRLEVRGGQAGFFTDAELADSAGVLWDPNEVQLEDGRVDPPPVHNSHSSFSNEQLVAFSEGRLFDCMGPGFEMAGAHTLSPAIQGDRMLLMDRVAVFDPQGGPWGRGYLQAVTAVSPDDWIYEGHFHNDPCMPGTLMFEGCLQTMAFYMAALGFSVERDGWRFQPVQDIAYQMRCRGQVDPTSKELIYEVFVREVWDDDEPTLFADLLVTVDGLKAFHAQGVGLRLVPDWPMLATPKIANQPFPGGKRPEGRPVASVDGFAFDYNTLLACAWGKPSHAFGEMYSRFDGPRTVARLPGPPYHFMSRIARIDGEMGIFQPGAKIVTEYDVPPGEWYFSENGFPTMPYAVLLEAGLQPCGWLASFIGSALTSDLDLQFRNLDGTATLTADILPTTGILRNEVHLTATSASAGVMIVRFDVEMFIGEQSVFTMQTAFGFFPKAAMASQAGLPANEQELALFNAPSDYHLDLTSHPSRFFDGTARIGKHKMLVLDRVTGYWPDGGEAGLGRMRAEKTVDPTEWFFKAHFFQDPVQPGSLGIEAMIQLLQIYMLERNMDASVPGGRFEPIALDRPMTWKYRGQVIPKNKLISTEIEITELGEDERGVFAIAKAWLWVDGKRIYSAVELGMRIVADDPRGASRDSDSDTEETALVPIATEAEAGDVSGEVSQEEIQVADSIAAAVEDDLDDTVIASPSTAAESVSVEDDYPVPASPDEEILSPERDLWLNDHCPTWTLPALPMMSMVDRLAAAAARRHPGLHVVGLENVQVRRWIAFPGGPVRLRTDIETEETHKSGAITLRVSLKVWRESARRELSRFEIAAVGTVWLAPGYATPPAPLAPLEGSPAEDPYASATLFHGPAFQLLKQLTFGKDGELAGAPGSSSILEADAGSVPWGTLHQALLDAATHGIPHDDLCRWSSEVADGFAAYPSVLDSAHFFGTPPTHGPVRCEARFEGLSNGSEGRPPSPVTRLQLIAGERVWAELVLREVLLPKGRLGTAPAQLRRSFLRDRIASSGVGLSRLSTSATHLSESEVAASDWLPGTVALAYGAEVQDRFGLTREVAIKDHISRHTGNHPTLIEVDLATASGVAAGQPLTRYAVSVTAAESGEITVSDEHPPSLDIGPLRRYWRDYFQRADTWAVEDIYYGLIERYVRRVVLTHPEEFKAIYGRPALFLANHQVGVESLLFSTLASALIGKPTITLAKDEHRTSWLGRLIKHCFSYPGIVDPELITFFERDNPRSLPLLIRELGKRMGDGERAVMVHSEGTRSLTCRKPVELLSGSFIDMAMKNGAPIVPVRFTGGLPVEPLEERIEFPLGHGRQDYWFGRPILPEELEPMKYRDRRTFVLEAMNHTGPDQSQETPHPGRPDFAAEVEAWIEATGASPEHAAIFKTLQQLENPGPETRRLLEGAQAGELHLDTGELGQWTAELAGRLFGERGPSVVVR